ncbi:MAG: ribosome small subunit-dependent GTPase A [Planctomycetes bacterium]|nr:ribosome small subunit-dependent GTPase A [Planctomycetota bacterium]
MELHQLGWNSHFESEFQRIPAAGKLLPARVAREDKTSYVVYSAGRALRATLRGALRHDADGRGDLPAVGDWVAVRPRIAEQAATIHAVLPRLSCVSRTAAGRRSDAQIVAANVDRLLICMGLDADFNPRRVERYLTLAHAGGVSPVVVLTKADLCESADSRRLTIEQLAAGAPVLVLCSLTGAGLDDLRPHLRTGLTAALVGSSGVGKSTLINALLGEERMATKAIREHDGRGRHTTTYRQLLLLPAGAILIDTPGMRELQLPADDAALEATFGEIDELAAACRFRDCSHESEPGCAVLAEVAAGRLDPQRLESWRKQAREVRYLETRDDPRAAAAEKARWKTIHKAARRWMEEKYGG